ncbi:MAG: LuxR C-terminal-related transcriptional regulator [Gemmatimonadota bacterium]
MTLTLSSTEQARLTAAARALLSPLDLPSTDGWRAEVLEHLTQLLEADAAGFILPVAGEAPYTLCGLPDRFAREYFETGRQAELSRDVLLRRGGGVWSTRLLMRELGLPEPEGWLQSDDYRHFYSRYGIRDAIGFMTYTAPGAAAGLADEGAEAVLTCFREVFGTELFGERGLAILELLVPALEAGVTTRLRLAGHERALEAVLDAAPYGILVYDLDGRRLFANAAFAGIVEGEPEEARLRARIREGIGSMAGLARSGDASGLDAFEGVSREVRTRGTRYRMRLNLIGEGLFTRQPVVLAALERVTRRPPSWRQLQGRWSLTPQEARVAALLATGKSNQEIADALDLSPATARHYTEAVFLKLDVHSRAEAASRILTV